jgi:hypothetical protein
MNNQPTGRTRKLLIRDQAGNELRIESSDSDTLERLESIYRNHSGIKDDRLLFADAGKRRILNDKNERIGDLWPELGAIEIIALPDTVNA